MQFTYFKSPSNLQELKSQYHQLVKRYHPDLNTTDTTADMKQINCEYEFLFEQLKHVKQSTGGSAQSTQEAPEANVDDMFREVINAIIHLNINIEICGSWVWVSGNTYPCKDTLKANNFKWSKGKKMWYWMPEDQQGKKRRGRYTMDKIREMHGSQTILTRQSKVLTA